MYTLPINEHNISEENVGLFFGQQINSSSCACILKFSIELIKPPLRDIYFLKIFTFCF